MGKGTWNSEWLKQLAVAVGYALVYFAEHPFSHAHFIFGSGVRLVFLLLLPYRYWPALVVGE
jgi:glucose-6-phosphate-specific signal transduction histidine kinase